MADFTVTISNSLNLFGGAPSNKWGAFEWGAFLWGEGTADMIQKVSKLISNDQASDTTISKNTSKVIAETTALASDMVTLRQSDGGGYYYVFNDNVTDADDRYMPDWAEQNDPSDTWSEQSDPSTDWSEP